MARRAHVMTPARKAALRKAQAASARKRRKGAKASNRKIYSSDPVKRGMGTSGLKKNLTPYVRANRRSQTIGVNTGTVIPFTGKRVAFGTYLRVESTKRPGSILPKFINDHVSFSTPAVRVNAGPAQFRLGSSRSGGATLIVRRGGHKAPKKASQAGVSKYQGRMVALKKTKKVRSQRRSR